MCGYMDLIPLANSSGGLACIQLCVHFWKDSLCAHCGINVWCDIHTLRSCVVTDTWTIPSDLFKYGHVTVLAPPGTCVVSLYHKCSQYLDSDTFVLRVNADLQVLHCTSVSSHPGPHRVGTNPLKQISLLPVWLSEGVFLHIDFVMSVTLSLTLGALYVCHCFIIMLFWPAVALNVRRRAKTFLPC